MIVPNFWAEASVKGDVDGRRITIRRFGWSNESEADAQVVATQRAQEGLAAAQRGEAVHRRDLKRPYNGSDGVPIREEVVERHGETVITRNSYGALCLNTPNVLFTDVDTAKEPADLGCLLFVGAAALGAGLHFWLDQLWTWLIPVAVFGVGSVWLKQWKAGAAERVLARFWDAMEEFVSSHPTWGCRVYETPGGFRVLVTHSLFDPRGEDAEGFMKALHSDSIYMRMCKKQNCFRARVSPKPWRVNIPDHIKPARGRWPVEPKVLVDRKRWVAQYEQACEGFASCRFVKAMGASTVCSEAQEVVERHDRMSRANSDLPIA